MFENIGRSTDGEQDRRRAASAGLTSILLGAVIGGFWLGVAMMTVSTSLEPPPETEPFFPIEILPEELVVNTPPALPRAPAKSRSGGGTPDENTPEAFDPDVQELDTDPPDEVVDPTFGKGPGKGPGTGDCVGDDCDPEEPSSGGGRGPRIIHHNDVDRKKKVDPEYPHAAKKLGLPGVTCRVRVTIDRRGIPTDAIVEDCPLVFHRESRNAMLRSRWYPPVVEGERLNSAQFLVVIHFDLR